MRGDEMTDRIELTRTTWNNFAERFTATANKRMTLQCAQHLHSYLQLECAQNVLEVAAGAGLGSLDIVQYLLEDRFTLPRDAKRNFTVTDLSPVMIDMARKNLRSVCSDTVQVHCREANGQALTEITTGSIDRYVASLCLQLTPDPDALLREAFRVLTADGIAGLTIWASPDRSGNFVISTAANKELGFDENVTEHPNFAMGKDLPALRQRFLDAGFTRVQVWPFQCVVELWSGEEFARFQEDVLPLEDKELQAQRFAVIKRMADEWLATGMPIGLETYIILARK